MDSRCQSLCSGLSSNKVLHNPQFLIATRLKSAGIMEHIAIMVREDEHVVNIVIATLAQGSIATSGKWYCITNIHGCFKLSLVGPRVVRLTYFHKS